MNKEGRMGINLDLRQKLKQELQLTPALIQTMKIMELSTLELKEKIEEELQSNPFLGEISDFSSGNDSEDRSEKDMPPQDRGSDDNAEIIDKKSDEDDEFHPGNYGSGFNETSPKIEFLDDNTQGDYISAPEENEDDVIENTLTYQETLEEHLMIQIHTHFDKDPEIEIADYIVGNLDDLGFSLLGDYDILMEFNTKYPDLKIEDITSIRERIKYFDPLGCASINSKEAILVQIDVNYGRNNELYRIIDQNWDLILDLKFEEISKKEGMSLEEIRTMVEQVRDLEVYPGRQFQEDNSSYIIPDVLVYLDHKDELLIILNDNSIPRFHLNTGYYEQINNDKLITRKERQRIMEKYDKAVFIIKAIYQRRRSLFLITKAIFKQQKEFLLKGIAGLKPLILKEIAKAVGMHESTVSRITRKKYVQTTSGIYQLKYFFSGKIDSVEENEDAVATIIVKNIIKEIIENEDRKIPLSDTGITEILRKKHSIKIARRTVAKYRDMLGIPNAAKRKKML